MTNTMPQTYWSRLLRAILEFDLIEPNDRILIGLSGGKDSLFLTHALSVLRDRLPMNISLHAVFIDAQFADDFDTTPLRNFCDRLDIPLTVQQVNIAQAIRNQDGKDPCFTCAFFRRGAIGRIAKELDCNKIAYAHHHDDAVETLLMGLFSSGQVKTFRPKTYLSRQDLTVIRPLIYFRESELADSVSIHGCPPLKNPCPLNGKTNRQDTKELIEQLSKQFPNLYAHLSAAMREDAVSDLWPKELTRSQMKEKHTAFMRLIHKK